MNNQNKVCVVGAGLVGSMLASYLAQQGFSCDVYEKRPDFRQNYQSGNRTITMSISYRGVKGLNGIGLSEYVDKYTIPKHSRMIHNIDGTTSSQMYGRKDQSINTIDRKHLNQTLIQTAEESGRVQFYFDHQCESINPDSGDITFLNISKLTTKTLQYRWIIGADGLFSNVRQILESHSLMTSEFLDVPYGYRELLIPPDSNGNYILAKDHVHVWPRENHIMVGLPSHKGQFTCNLFLPSDGNHSLNSMQTEKAVEELFRLKFPKLRPLMPTLVEDYFRNPASHIHAIKSGPWNYKDKILLIGDAAHAIVPFFAMGMNTCFEDCTLFNDLLKQYNNDLSKVFLNFYNKRKKDTDAISNLSYSNFSEISKSPEENYDLLWKLDRLIWELYPEKWMPCYSMVAFTDIPFSIAAERTTLQNKLLQEIIDKHSLSSMNDFSSITIQQLITPLLQNMHPLPTH